MRLQLLGPLEVRCGDRLVKITAGKQRTILTMLAANAGRVVRVESLVTEVWGHEPPKSAMANLRTYVMQLRKLRLFEQMDGAELVTTEAGYLLRIDPGDVDLYRFEAALEQARKATADADLSAADTALGEALALWRGEVAEDVELGPALRNVAARFGELYATALEDHADVKLALGDHAAAVNRLRELLAHHPLRERAYGQLMLALYQRGDIDDALAMYSHAYEMLTEELGIEPGPELSSLHQAILRRDPDLAPVGADTGKSGKSPGTVDSRPEPPRGSPLCPRELPRNPATFVGRSAELDRICGILRDTEGTTRVVAIHGPGGIGKSTLALRAAYTVADEFPDGHLYVDLQGATPGLPRLEPAEVLARFLRALGMSRADLPATQAEAVTRFQSTLAGRRVLIVLDNAASAAQVARLLPADNGCAVLVTSRAVLPTLDAEPVGLQVLDEADAVQLLALTAGARRVAAEPDLAAEVARQCGNHPLALRIAGARLSGRPDWSLARLEARLRDQRRRLDELSADDLDVRSCFAVSYEALLAGTKPGWEMAARVFRLLGTLEVAELGTELVAALAGVQASVAEDALDELVAVRLVEAVAGGRFRIHDLLRLYAAEVAQREIPADEREQALKRALDWYLRTCRAAVDELTEVAGGEEPGSADALRWFDIELTCLVSAAVQASESGAAVARFVTDLLALVKPLALKRGCWHELEVLAQLAIEVSAGLGDTAAQHLALATSTTIHWRAGRPDEAGECILRGLELARAAGDVETEVRALHNLGWLRMHLGDAPGALEPMTEAIALMGDREDPAVTGFLWHTEAEVLLRLDRVEEALGWFEMSLAARRQRGDRLGESITLAGLGRAYCLLDRQKQALATFDAAVLRCQEVGNREDEWEILLCRSEIRLRRGEPATAVADLRRAGELARQVSDVYGQAAVLRQLAKALDAQGDNAAAESARRRAEPLFTAPSTRVDPVLEKLLDPQGSL
jgi:DNA-binding SARP family transcriptional activator